MNLTAAALTEQIHGASRLKDNTIYIFRKAVYKMTEIKTLTGSESAGELMRLRRSILSTRRIRKAALLTAGTSRTEKGEGNIIRFPSPEYPLIA